MTSESKHHAPAGWLDAWHVNPSLSKDYDAIDGLRGIAILLVIACHLFYVNPEAGTAAQFVGHLFGAGTWGVTIFFTLSGFLISHPFWKRKIRGSMPVAPPGYGLRRFWKIYPPLALSIVLLTPVYIAGTRDTSFIALAGQWLVGWPLVHSVRSDLNPVMWSLIVEVHFYILLPILFLSVKRLSAKSSLWTIFLILLIVPTAFRWWNMSHGVFFELHPDIQLRFPTYFDAFAFGVLLAGLENLQMIKKTWARLGDLGFLLLAASVLGLAWFETHPTAALAIQSEALTWVVKLASAMLLCYIANPDHPRARLLCAPWLRWCGVISYEWYLFHQPIVLWTRFLLGPAEGNAAKFGLIIGGSLLSSLVIAALVYRYFSLPILKYGRGKSSAHLSPSASSLKPAS